MITFSHPYTGPTLSLELPNPGLGNAEQFDLPVIYRKTMSGDLHTNIRNQGKKLVLTFTLLKNTEIDGLISFIKTVRDDEFKYTDHEAVVWKVKFPASNYAYSWTGRYSRVIPMTLEVVT